MVTSKRLKMINHEAGPEHLGGENGRFAALDGRTTLDHGDFHERSPRHLLHLPRDYELAIRWLRPSFLTRDHWTPGQQCPGSHIRLFMRRASLRM